MGNKDYLFANPLAALTAFKFDAAVVAVFEDMIKRSVPGYEAIISMIGELAGRYARDNTRCYDLGCSLGAASLAMAHGIQRRGCKIIGVDNSPDMIEQCQQMLTKTRPPIPIELLCDDINNVSIDNASLVVLNFTLQFIPVAARQALIDRIHQGLVQAGY